MIVKCDIESIDNIIKNIRESKLTNVRIVRDEIDGLMAFYNLLCDDEYIYEKERILNIMKNSIQVTFDVLSELNNLKKAMINNVEPLSYELEYDCTVNKNVALHTFSATFPANYKNIVANETEGINSFKETKEKPPVSLSLKEMFADKLDKQVPFLYTKKPSKKYNPVTYRELVELLK